MRVALVSTADIGGGAERAANDLAAGLSRAGHDVTMFCWHVVERERPRPFAVEHLVEMRPLPRHPTMAVLEIGDKLRRRFDGFDAVHVHDAQWDRRQPVLFAALHWLSHHVPVFWTLHNFWPITGGCAFPGDCPRFGGGCGDCPQLGDPLIGDTDHTAAWSAIKTAAWRESRVTPIVPSRWAAAQAARVLRPVGKHATIVIHGTCTGTFAPPQFSAFSASSADELNSLRAFLGFSADSPLILFLQNCCTDLRKNPDFIRELASAAAGRCQLLIVGREAAPFARSLDPRTRAVGIDYVTDEAQLASLYAAADVTLQPSDRETFGLTLIESLACGTPVCAKRVCAFPEIIDDRRTGWLLPADAAPRDVITRLDDWSPRRINDMRAACREAAVTRFNIARVIEEHVRLYSSAFSSASTEAGEPRPAFVLGEAVQRTLESRDTPQLNTALLQDTAHSTAPVFRRRYVRTLWRALAAEGKPVAIYGAGKHTRWLLQAVWDVPGPDLVCVLDDNPPPEGELCGQPVRRPVVGKPPAPRILVSSDAHEEKLAARCRELFGDAAEIIRLYAGLPAGPYP